MIDVNLYAFFQKHKVEGMLVIVWMDRRLCILLTVVRERRTFFLVDPVWGQAVGSA